MAVACGAACWTRTRADRCRESMSAITVRGPRSGECLVGTTDANGEFSFRVPPGPSHVYVMDGKHSGPAVERRRHGAGKSGLEPVELQISENRNLRRVGKSINRDAGRAGRRQERESVIGGDDSVSGIVVDPSGKPIQAARLFHLAHPPDKFVTTDESGAFVFFGMGQGSSFTLRAFKEGYHVWGGFPRTGEVLRIELEPKVTTSPGAHK